MKGLSNYSRPSHSGVGAGVAGMVQRDEVHQSLSVSVSRAGKGGNSSLGKLNIWIYPGCCKHQHRHFRVMDTGGCSLLSSWNNGYSFPFSVIFNIRLAATFSFRPQTFLFFSDLSFSFMANSNTFSFACDTHRMTFNLWICGCSVHVFSTWTPPPQLELVNRVVTGEGTGDTHQWEPSLCGSARDN